MKIKLEMLIPLLLIGCTESLLEPELQKESIEEPTRLHVRTLDDALKNADNWFNQMDSLNHTRNISQREVESIEIIKNPSLTRAGESDTLFYLVNYASQKGFALLGAPEGSADIYAISDEGRLLMSDTTYNVGLKIFIDTSIAHAENSSIIDSDPYPAVIVKRKGGVALNSNVSKWGQGSPFNQYCPISPTGIQGKVGCGAVALGMLMAHYEWPKVIAGNTLNWTNMKENNDYSSISFFLETLASPNYLNSFYSDTINYSRRTSITTSFHIAASNCGYDLSYLWDYTPFHNERKSVFDFMKSGIKNKLSAGPIIFYGSRNSSGHFWIADMFAERVKNIGGDGLLFPEELVETDPLIHMVWGWNGYANGYFLYLLNDKKMDTTNVNGDNCPYQYGGLRTFGRLKIPD